MHPVKKGVLGELSVTKRLIELDYQVFTPVSPNTRIDLIAIKNDQLIKLQVKSTTSINDCALLNLRKNTLNSKYNYTYSETDFDYFALYVEDKNTVIFIKANEALNNNKTCMKFRFEFQEQKKKNQFDQRYIRDYLVI